MHLIKNKHDLFLSVHFLRLTTVSHAYKRWWIFTPGRRGHHGCDRMGVGFTNTCAISAYHH